MISVIYAAAAVAFVYFILVKPFYSWKRRGVPQAWLLEVWIGNIVSIFQLKTAADMLVNVYKQFSEYRYGGAYLFFSPILFIRDPDLIKQMTVKDFDHFVDHNPFITEEQEPLWGKNLFALKGDKWRDMRATLSPSFTSSKMRAMFGLMSDCAQQFVGYFERADSKQIDAEFKDTFSRFANDMIATTAFGVTCDSLTDRENEFYLMGKKATNFRGFWVNFKFIVLFFLPRFSKLIGLSMLPSKVSEFFRRLVKTNIESREKNGIVRPDMIHLLMEARKGRLTHDTEEETKVVDNGFAVIEESLIGKEVKRQKPPLSDDDLTAQAFIFFFAGFDTVSAMMCFLSYELAVNPDIQQKVREEIEETTRQCKGKLTYEALLKMNYLDMVLSETLRKWPIAIQTDRECVKDYVIEPTRLEEQPVCIKKGDQIWVPIYAIHHDPQYYPEPERFDPERFSEENKAKIYPYTYLPFGVGPRSCIGNRFALLEIKTVFFYLLSKFDIVVVDKSPVPMKLAKDQFNLAAEAGFWFGLEARVSN